MRFAASEGGQTSPQGPDSRVLLAALEKRVRVAAFENSRLRLVQKNTLLSLYAVPVFGIVTGALFLGWVPFETIAAWVVFYVVVETAGLVFVRRFDVNSTDAKVVGRKLTLAGILLGLGIVPWALLPLFFGESGGDTTRFLTLLLEAGAIPYVMAASSASRRTYFLHSAPITASLVFAPILQGGDLAIPLAGLASVYAIVMHGVAMQLHGLLATMFEAKESNLHLLEQVAHAKAESDAARLRAERSSQAKSTFLANMSHELRTPLNAILGFSEVITTELVGPVGTPLYRDYAADIHASGKHLLGLINDILDLSRIEAGRLELVLETVSLNTHADYASRFVAQLANKNGVTIAKDVAPDFPFIRMDERALRQVLINLLSNAVKFTPRGGRVTIRARKGSSVFGQDGLTVTIADTGIGIRKEDIPLVLESFGQARVDDFALTVHQGQGGTGLGLPIVRGLLEAHGASFELKSEFGKWTEAIAHLPPGCAGRAEDQEPQAAAG